MNKWRCCHKQHGYYSSSWLDILWFFALMPIAFFIADHPRLEGAAFGVIIAWAWITRPCEES